MQKVIKQTLHTIKMWTKSIEENNKLFQNEKKWKIEERNSYFYVGKTKNTEFTQIRREKILELRKERHCNRYHKNKKHGEVK